MKLLEHIGNLISKYMAILVILMAGAALAMPRTFAGIAPHVSLLLGIVMFGMGMTLRGSDFRRVLEHPRDVCIGVLAQFTIMPLLAWLLAKGFALSPDLAVGVILVGTCPGGTSSNVMTYLARGDVALSVSMTMTTTLLAPLVTPFLTWQLAGAWVEVSFTAMMLSIVKVVILPIAAGVAMNAFFAEAVRRIVKLLPLGIYHGDYPYCRRRGSCQCQPYYGNRAAGHGGGDLPQSAGICYRFRSRQGVSYGYGQGKSHCD